MTERICPWCASCGWCRRNGCVAVNEDSARRLAQAEAEARDEALLSGGTHYVSATGEVLPKNKT